MIGWITNMTGLSYMKINTSKLCLGFSIYEKWNIKLSVQIV